MRLMNTVPILAAVTIAAGCGSSPHNSAPVVPVRSTADTLSIEGQVTADCAGTNDITLEEYPHVLTGPAIGLPVPSVNTATGGVQFKYSNNPERVISSVAYQVGRNPAAIAIISSILGEGRTSVTIDDSSIAANLVFQNVENNSNTLKKDCEYVTRAILRGGIIRNLASLSGNVNNFLPVYGKDQNGQTALAGINADPGGLPNPVEGVTVKPIEGTAHQSLQEQIEYTWVYSPGGKFLQLVDKNGKNGTPSKNGQPTKAQLGGILKLISGNLKSLSGGSSSSNESAKSGSQNSESSQASSGAQGTNGNSGRRKSSSSSSTGNRTTTTRGGGTTTSRGGGKSGGGKTTTISGGSGGGNGGGGTTSTGGSTTSTSTTTPERTTSTSTTTPERTTSTSTTTPERTTSTSTTTPERTTSTSTTTTVPTTTSSTTPNQPTTGTGKAPVPPNLPPCGPVTINGCNPGSANTIRSNVSYNRIRLAPDLVAFSEGKANIYFTLGEPKKSVFKKATADLTQLVTV